MRGVPFTPCKLRRAWGPDIPEDTFLIAKTTAYRVERVVGRTLHCTRWPIDEVPADAAVMSWKWGKR